jgi:serine/threonine protein kinase
LDKDKIQTRNMGAQIKKEISIMKMISHHHVVSVKDVFATSAKIFIVLEFVGGGELFDKIANEGKLPEEKARFYFKQLVEGLEHCHNNGVCHRDLKPEVKMHLKDPLSFINLGCAESFVGHRW